MSGKQGGWSRIGVNGRGLGGGMHGCSPGDETQTLMRCHSSGLPQLYEAFEGWKTREKSERTERDRGT